MKISEIEINKTIANLKRNNMNGYYVENKNELIRLLESLLQENETVGCGDSATLEQTGVFDYLKIANYKFLDKHQCGLTAEKKREIYIENFNADTFISGTNAITIEGKIFNIDGNGSRIAPILYGPKQVIIIVGTNKIVKSVDEAIHRTRQIAAPMDAKRLVKNTPCVKLLKCIDCHHKQRICNDFVLITGQFDANRIKVIIIDGDYGY